MKHAQEKKNLKVHSSNSTWNYQVKNNNSTEAYFHYFLDESMHQQLWLDKRGLFLHNSITAKMKTGVADCGG